MDKMVSRVTHLVFGRFLVAGMLLWFCGPLSGCRKHKSGDKKPEAPAPAKAPFPQQPKATEALSMEIEALTGAHTRVVWNECQIPKESDPFSHTNQQVLRGIDTRDGLGERTIIEDKGNYSRPVITPDGKTILYSNRRTVKSKGRKDYVVTVLRTDWQGSKPVELSQGYVVDVWRDPKTGIDWVYCTRKYRSVHGPGLVARQLWRFQLEKPKTAELVYDDAKLTPDNIQLSRDGNLICGQFPWPHGGVLHMESDPPQLRLLTNGCWTSCAPDASGVSWVFDGSHKGATFFTADGEHSWYVPFDAPCAKIGETYHPRWTNDARFMVLTGPYIPESSGGMAVPSDRNKAEVYIGKLAPDAKKTEGWVKVSHRNKPTAYPDAWIEGGEKSELKPQAQPKKAGAVLAENWPAKAEGLIFLWRDRKALNEWKDRSGHVHTAEIEAKGTARYGRNGEMIFNGGEFELEDDEDSPQLATLKAAPAAAFQATLYPTTQESEGWLLRSPAFSVYLRKGAVGVLSKDGQASQAALPDASQPVHVAVNVKAGQVEVFVNGKFAPLLPSAPPPMEKTEQVTLGSSKAPRGMDRVALYERTLSAEEISADAAGQLARLAALPPAPSQVRLVGKLVEVSKIPTLESIEPYTSALLSYVYEVEQVVSGEFTEKRVLVKHWGLLNKNLVAGFPRQVGQSYPLTIERESDHAELQGERVSDDTTAFDLTPWFDVSPFQNP